MTGIPYEQIKQWRYECECCKEKFRYAQSLKDHKCKNKTGEEK